MHFGEPISSSCSLVFFWLDAFWRAYVLLMGWLWRWNVAHRLWCVHAWFWVTHVSHLIAIHWWSIRFSLHLLSGCRWYRRTKLVYIQTGLIASMRVMAMIVHLISTLTLWPYDMTLWHYDHVFLGAMVLGDMTLWHYNHVFWGQCFCLIWHYDIVIKSFRGLCSC